MVWGVGLCVVAPYRESSGSSKGNAEYGPGSDFLISIPHGPYGATVAEHYRDIGTPAVAIGCG